MKRIIESKIQLKENTRKIYITSKVKGLTRDDLEVYLYEMDIYDTYEEGIEELFGHIKSIELDTNREYKQSEKKSKPNGLWYCYDYSWIYFLRINGYIDEKGFSEMDENDKSVFNVNAVTVAEIPENLNILSLMSESELRQFSGKYVAEGISDKNSYNNYSHNWKRVSEKYDGIEILEPVVSNRDFYLSMDWDIPSGCIWKGLDKIKVIKTIPLVQFIKEEKVFSNNW